jgi:hypothetical protein
MLLNSNKFSGTIYETYREVHLWMDVKWADEWFMLCLKKYSYCLT